MRRYLRPLKRLFGPAGCGGLTLRDEAERGHLRAYRDFYTNNLEHLKSFKQVVYYDSLRNEFTQEAVMRERIPYHTFGLQDHVDAMADQYDVTYQDIEVLQAVGYSESYQSWAKIRSLIDWKDQQVIDLGCFHGYFSFKIEDCGGRVCGFERSTLAIETATMINALRGGHVEFQLWTGGEPIPPCDVIICLNVLHHFGNVDVQEKVVAGMQCRTALFEINEEQLPMIDKHFTMVRRHPSHRKHRMIVVASSPRRPQ